MECISWKCNQCNFFKWNYPSKKRIIRSEVKFDDFFSEHVLITRHSNVSKGTRSFYRYDCWWSRDSKIKEPENPDICKNQKLISLTILKIGLFHLENSFLFILGICLSVKHVYRIGKYSKPYFQNDQVQSFESLSKPYFYNYLSYERGI